MNHAIATSSLFLKILNGMIELKNLTNLKNLQTQGAN
jgi:hypothetical protein